METTQLLVDTSVIIEFLRKKNKKNSVLWKLVGQFDLFISSITTFELYAGANSSKKQKDLDILMKGFSIIDFSDEISIRSAKLYRHLKKVNKSVEFRDIFIAATELYFDMPIITYNIKHFQRIPELRLFNIDEFDRK